MSDTGFKGVTELRAQFEELEQRSRSLKSVCGDLRRRSYSLIEPAEHTRRQIERIKDEQRDLYRQIAVPSGSRSSLVRARRAFADNEEKLVELYRLLAFQQQWEAKRGCADGTGESESGEGDQADGAAFVRSAGGS